jgi:hypothetical protein
MRWPCHYRLAGMLLLAMMRLSTNASERNGLFSINSLSKPDKLSRVDQSILVKSIKISPLPLGEGA